MDYLQTVMAPDALKMGEFVLLHHPPFQTFKRFTDSGKGARKSPKIEDEMSPCRPVIFNRCT